MEVLTHIREGKGARPVHACLAVDIHNSRPRPKELVEFRLKFGVPIQNIDIDAVDAIKTDVLFRVSIGEPLGACTVIRAVDDMGNVLLGYEPLC